MSEKKEHRQRLNLHVVPEIKDYIVKGSEEMGMSQGAFVTMIIQTYRNQKDTITLMNDFLVEIRKQNGDISNER